MPGLDYAFAKPDELADAVAAGGIAYLPVGCVEYHGPHLPVGVDMLTADSLCQRAAVITGGAVLPPLWLAAGVLPLPFGVSVSTGTMRRVVAEILDQLVAHGFRVLIIVSGHGALDHLHALRLETDAVMDRHSGVRALTTMWNELNVDLDGDIHDHGAKVETSFIMEFHPDAVDLSALSDDPTAEHLGVYAANPRFTASREWGSTMAAHAVTVLSEQVAGMVAGGPADSWGRFTALVERLQGGDLRVVGGRSDEGAFEVDLANDHPQSKYITAVESLVVGGHRPDLSDVVLTNPSKGEGHTDRRADRLDPLNGFYVRRRQTMRLRVHGAALPTDETVEVTVRLRLADVLTIGASGSIEPAPDGPLSA